MKSCAAILEMLLSGWGEGNNSLYELPNTTTLNLQSVGKCSKHNRHTCKVQT